jgi:hypothetical protein
MAGRRCPGATSIRERPEMDNRRKQKRYFMFDILEVSLPGLGEDIGHLVDITEDGLMIRCGVPVEVDQVYLVQVNLQDAVPGEAKLELSARCQWCRPAPTLGGYNAGFHMSDLSPHSIDVINALTLQEAPIESN